MTATNTDGQILPYGRFLLIAYAVAGFFEWLANTIGDGKLFEQPGWPVFFIIWYGASYSASYLGLRHKPLWLIAAVWAVLGPLAEALLFHRLNIIVDPVIYALMGLIPFRILRKLGTGRCL